VGACPTPTAGGVALCRVRLLILGCVVLFIWRHCVCPCVSFCSISTTWGTSVCNGAGELSYCHASNCTMPRAHGR
jgi:hypothetical protein